MKTIATHGTIRSGIEYWPSYVDILTTVLMVFILQNFLQTTLNIENFEAARIRQSQHHLREILESEFPEETQNHKITLDDSKPNLLQIRFSEEILFASADYHLAATGRAVLGKCARVLGARPGSGEYKQIEVQGHTDKRPMRRSSYPRNNWELSAARAIEVVRFLLENGISPRKLSAGGYAEFRPVELSSARQGLNRRIELRILFATPDQPQARLQ